MAEELHSNQHHEMPDFEREDMARAMSMRS